MSEWVYLSTEGMTITVRTEDGIIVEGPPIVKKFMGQPLRNLMRWLGNQAGLRVQFLV